MKEKILIQEGKKIDDHKKGEELESNCLVYRLA